MPVLERLEALAGGEPPAMLLMPTAEFVGLLPSLVGHPRVWLGKSRRLDIRTDPWRPKVRAALLSSGEITLCSDLAAGEVPVVLTGETVWVFHGSVIQPLALPRDYIELLRGPMQIPRSRVPQLLGPDWPKLQAGGELEADFEPEDFGFAPLTPRFVLSLHGGLAQLQAVLQCRYGIRIVTPGVTSPDDAVWLPDPHAITQYSTRDLTAEQAALARLWRSGFRGPDAQGRLEVKGQDAVLQFFAREYPRLIQEWDVTLDERMERCVTQNLERVTPEFRVLSSGEQWFDLAIAYKTPSGEVLSAVEVQRLLLSGQGFKRLSNGRVAILDTGAVEELQAVLRDCDPRQEASGYRVPQTQAAYLDATLREHAGWQWQAPAAWRERMAQQQGKIQMPSRPLGSLETVLRPYQKDAVAWLDFLRRNHFGGLLADEMGLGKTLQTLAFLLTNKRDAQQREAGREDPGLPSLVVCPTSLVFNWQAEAQRFTPELSTLILHGPQRESRFTEIPRHDLVITSYALMRRDAERYRSFEFDTVVLDEAQHIKNRQTQNAQAVKSVRARHRLVLTGTPLENSVLDLWSLFDFLMPGYLGSDRDFRERYEIPLTRGSDPQIQARLARRIRPFVLRRSKKEVAPELPEKIEQIAYCGLTEAQAAVYQEILQASRRQVLEAVNAKGLAQSRMIVLTALLRLRQICCDLRLLKLENIDPDTASAKLDLFGELLDEALDGNHRVLVFSQFVALLTLVKDKLENDHIPFCYLDGSTQDRAGEVARFQKSPDIPVFLISLKAGGLGLNLTAADTVIHFDPWWNPAVEDQATDRAHRIGQNRVVTSYKLITQGTVEEKILNLQQRKRKLIHATLAGEERLSEILTWEEIQELLA
jgi:superfamily II DNA or RNA helicase